MTFLTCNVVGAAVVDSFSQSRHAWSALRASRQREFGDRYIDFDFTQLAGEHEPQRETRYVSWPKLLCRSCARG